MLESRKRSAGFNESSPLTALQEKVVSIIGYSPHSYSNHMVIERGKLLSTVNEVFKKKYSLD